MSRLSTMTPSAHSRSGTFAVAASRPAAEASSRKRGGLRAKSISSCSKSSCRSSSAIHGRCAYGQTPLFQRRKPALGVAEGVKTKGEASRQSSMRPRQRRGRGARGERTRARREEAR
eukprot:2777370-Prymnesium_polylepis.2